MSNYEDMASEETEDRFYAQFDSREVELMTLDGLQAAFEAGRIHENTFVCREGDDQWLTLAEVAGLGDEPEPEPVVVAERRPPMPQRRPEVVETRPPMPERRPAMNTVPAQRFQSTVAPVVSSVPLSYAPVSSNISYSDLDELGLRPKRRWGRVLFAAAALTLVGGGAAFALGGGARSLGLTVPSMASLASAGNKTQASLTLDSIQTKPADPAPAAAPVVPSTPEPVAAAAPTAAPASDAPSSATPQLTDDVKQALLASDKVHETKHAAKVKARAASSGGASVAHHGKAASVGGGFKSGGSAYDPLNGKL